MEIATLNWTYIIESSQENEISQVFDEFAKCYEPTYNGGVEEW